MKSLKNTKLLGNTLYVLLVTSLIVMAISVIYSRASGGEPKLFGYQFKTVLSGSMEPTFKTGSLIAVKEVTDPTKLKKDDVITFKAGTYSVITHRIIDVVNSNNELMYITKGDNNENADMNGVLPENVMAKYTGFTIPYVGYLLSFASSKIGSALLLIIPGILLLGYSVLIVRQVINDIEKRALATSSNQIDKTM